MLIVRMFLSLLLPPALLATLLSLANVAGKISVAAGEFLEAAFGVLLFWPLALYQNLSPEPACSWESWWNHAVAPCAGAVVIGYILLLFLLMGRLQLFKTRNPQMEE